MVLGSRRVLLYGELWRTRVRNARIARREWFDINDFRRERPLLRYVTPILVGTAFGAATLSIIAVIGGPGFKASFGEAGNAIRISSAAPNRLPIKNEVMCRMLTPIGR